MNPFGGNERRGSVSALDLECPRCKQKFAVDVAPLMPGRIVPCPHCGFEITFTRRDLDALRESRGRVGKGRR